MCTTMDQLIENDGIASLWDCAEDGAIQIVPTIQDKGCLCTVKRCDLVFESFDVNTIPIRET